jgi:multicomponent Na+:H+ antiporter subunit C
MLYALTGAGLIGLGVRGVLLSCALVRRVIALNVMGAGVFLILIATAYRGTGQTPDPVPHALVLTGIVVAVSATALALALARRLREHPGDE